MLEGSASVEGHGAWGTAGDGLGWLGMAWDGLEGPAKMMDVFFLKNDEVESFGKTNRRS